MEVAAEMTWLLLIYTVPRSPSRKRAFVWRELKKLGGLYLRDGVVALPERPDTATAIQQVAGAIREYGGRAIVVAAVNLDARTTAELVEEATDDRQSEYAEIATELSGFLDHLHRERAHRTIEPPELDALKGDLEKVRRWLDQVRGRDYFAAGPPDQLVKRVEQADEALAAIRDDLSVTAERAG
jgi:hypothetical protein